jgi:hypothetical protein
MTNLAKTGGIAIILFGLLYLASFVLGSPVVGLTDGDNPVTSLEFLKQHGDFYFLSGLTSALAAIALTVAVLSVADVMLQPATALLTRTTSTFGLFTAMFLFGHGVLRMNSPGTLGYMADLNRDWGLSAYLAVQMAGTQGLAAAGIFGFSVWAIGLSLEGWRSRKLPLALAVFGVVPALPWLMGLLGRAGALPDSLWLLYISSIILGIPLWSVILGIFLLWRKPTT